MLQEKFIEVIETPFLWKDSLLGLQQYNLPLFPIREYPVDNHPSHLRLGKQIESFVDFQLEQHPNITVLDRNLQIISNKRTLGEIDFLIRYKGTPIHVEVVYKFYIYNPEIGNTEMDHWIGPNNKDCLLYKIEKLKTKQLPLLYKPETEIYLKHHNLTSKDITQHVYFKAQLFVPYKSTKTNYQHINTDCIKGFYITLDQLHEFETYSFYIPHKHDWILPITENTEWMDFKSFVTQIENCKQRKQAPLCWLRSLEGKLSKCFVYFKAEITD